MQIYAIVMCSWRRITEQVKVKRHTNDLFVKIEIAFPLLYNFIFVFVLLSVIERLWGGCDQAMHSVFIALKWKYHADFRCQWFIM